MIDRPFTAAKELIAGYWLIRVKSKEEAIEWAKPRKGKPKIRAPHGLRSWVSTSGPASH